jgi:hypothetical protein
MTREWIRRQRPRLNRLALVAAALTVLAGSASWPKH